jgi:hypothetical protein
MLSWSTLEVEVEVDDNVLRVSLVIKTVASALREVSHSRLRQRITGFSRFLWLRITHKAESLVEH